MRGPKSRLADVSNTPTAIQQSPRRPHAWTFGRRKRTAQRDQPERPRAHRESPGAHSALPAAAALLQRHERAAEAERGEQCVSDSGADPAAARVDLLLERRGDHAARSRARRRRAAGSTAADLARGRRRDGTTTPVALIGPTIPIAPIVETAIERGEAEHADTRLRAPPRELRTRVGGSGRTIATTSAMNTRPAA